MDSLYKWNHMWPSVSSFFLVLCVSESCMWSHCFLLNNVSWGGHATLCSTTRLLLPPFGYYGSCCWVPAWTLCPEWAGERWSGLPDAACQPLGLEGNEKSWAAVLSLSGTTLHPTTEAWGEGRPCLPGALILPGRGRAGGGERRSRFPAGVTASPVARKV